MENTVSARRRKIGAPGKWGYLAGGRGGFCMGLAKCACIDTLYTELPWRERFSAAREDGFAAVEFWDWRARDLEEMPGWRSGSALPCIWKR